MQIIAITQDQLNKDFDRFKNLISLVKSNSIDETKKTQYKKDIEDLNSENLSEEDFERRIEKIEEESNGIKKAFRNKNTWQNDSEISNLLNNAEAYKNLRKDEKKKKKNVNKKKKNLKKKK